MKKRGRSRIVRKEALEAGIVDVRLYGSGGEPSQSFLRICCRHIQRKIEQSRMVQTLTQTKNNPREIVNGLYLAVLSRFPTEAERELVTAQFQNKNVKNREAAVDLVWALLNSTEFRYRH